MAKCPAMAKAVQQSNHFNKASWNKAAYTVLYYAMDAVSWLDVQTIEAMMCFIVQPFHSTKEMYFQLKIRNFFLKTLVKRVVRQSINNALDYLFQNHSLRE